MGGFIYVFHLYLYQSLFICDNHNDTYYYKDVDNMFHFFYFVICFFDFAKVQNKSKIKNF